MREENYFKIKLQNAKDTLVMAERSLESLDIQINLLKVRFDHDKKVYDDQAIHMQNIVKDMEKRIPNLEKQIEKGFVTIDMKSGRGYTSHDARHKGELKFKLDLVKEQQKAIAARKKTMKALRKKPLDKLKPEQKDAVIAEQIKEAMQPPDELKENQEREKERLQAKADKYQKDLEDLEAKMKAPKELKAIVFDAVGNEVKAEEQLIADQAEAADEAYLDDKKEIAENLRNVADLMNGERKELETLLAMNQAYVKEYAETEGGKAVWQGKITKGFRLWLESKGYKIGG